MSDEKRLQFALDDLEDARDALRRYRRAMLLGWLLTVAGVALAVAALIVVGPPWLLMATLFVVAGRVQFGRHPDGVSFAKLTGNLRRAERAHRDLTMGW